MIYRYSKSVAYTDREWLDQGKLITYFSRMELDAYRELNDRMIRHLLENKLKVCDYIFKYSEEMDNKDLDYQTYIVIYTVTAFRKEDIEREIGGTYA